MLMPPSGRLLPVCMPLLPPVSRLSPPASAAAGAAAGEIAAHSAQVLGRALERARGMGRQTLTQAAENAPAWRQRAAELAGAASAGSAAALDRALEAARASRVERMARTKPATMAAAPPKPPVAASERRQMALVALGTLVVCCGVVFALAQRQANAVARAEVPRFLARHGLQRAITYQSIAASPFGSVTLNGVVVHAGPTPIAVASLTIRNVIMGPQGARRATLSFNRAVAPLLELARTQDAPLLLHSLLGLGFTAVFVNGTVDVAIDDARRTAEMTVSAQAADIGTLHAHASLGGIDAARFDRLLSPAGSSAQATHGLTLAAADISLDDAPLFARAQRVPDASIPDEAGNFTPIPPEDAADFAGFVPPGDIVQAWLAHGGALTIKVNPPTPIPLFDEHEFAPGVKATLSVSAN
jgi:hypothetical protein